MREMYQHFFQEDTELNLPEIKIFLIVVSNLLYYSYQEQYKL